MSIEDENSKPPLKVTKLRADSVQILSFLELAFIVYLYEYKKWKVSS